jgi:hypothetical protein
LSGQAKLKKVKTELYFQTKIAEQRSSFLVAVALVEVVKQIVTEIYYRAT